MTNLERFKIELPAYVDALPDKWLDSFATQVFFRASHPDMCILAWDRVYERGWRPDGYIIQKSLEIRYRKPFEWLIERCGDICVLNRFLNRLITCSHYDLWYVTILLKHGANRLYEKGIHIESRVEKVNRCWVRVLLMCWSMKKVCTLPKELMYEISQMI